MSDRIPEGRPAIVDYPGNFLHGRRVEIVGYFKDELLDGKLMATIQPPRLDGLTNSYVMPVERLRPVSAEETA
jgi:hypothetical protein